MKINSHLKKAISLLLVLAAILSLCLGFSSCSSGIGGTSAPGTPEELLLEISKECEKELDTVADYLDFWDFPEFSKSKIVALERLYR